MTENKTGNKAGKLIVCIKTGITKNFKYEIQILTGGFFAFFDHHFPP
jgi:hypothetical protein